MGPLKKLNNQHKNDVLFSTCIFPVQRLDWEELTVISTSTPTVEQTNQGVQKPYFQVNTHTKQSNTHSLITAHTHTAVVCLPQVKRTLCVTTSAPCSSSCALWIGPAASPVTPARPTATSWRAAACSVKPSNPHPAPCSVRAETRTRTRLMTNYVYTSKEFALVSN